MRVNRITSTGHDAIKPLRQSEVPAMVKMIGSMRGGLDVMNAFRTSVKHFSIELGGNAPMLVYPNAAIENAANMVIDLKFANCGQIWVSPNHCFVPTRFTMSLSKRPSYAPAR